MKLNLRATIGSDELDYSTLMSALSQYTSPRAKVTSLLKSKEIIRIKKGLYIFGSDSRKNPICKEHLANLIHGPSILSLESALAYYNIIPERVEAITSVCLSRPKRFETPIGLFIYRPTPTLSIGVERITLHNTSFFIATPERALADKLRDDRNGSLRTEKEMGAYLFENLRIEPLTLKTFNYAQLDQLALSMKSNKVHVCARLVNSIQRKSA